MGVRPLNGTGSHQWKRTISKDARDYAEQVSDHLVLVNGRKLTELMIEHGVGVSHKSIQLPQIDSDYFDEG